MLHLKSRETVFLMALIFMFGCVPGFYIPARADSDIFDAASYELNDTINLSVDDMTMNITSGADVVVANLRSNSDLTGIYIDLVETGADTGQFTGSATAKTSSDDTANEIETAPGDSLAVSYAGSADTDTAVMVTPSLGYSGTTFTEAAADNGSIQNTLTLTLAHDNFTVPAGVMTSGVHYDATNVPAGLTMVITGTSSTTATVQLTGNATSHAVANSIANMGITFKDAAFAWGDAAAVSGYEQSSLSVTFVSAAVAPTFVSATTNASGSQIEITFSEAMANPSGKQAQFAVNDGASNTVTSIALKSGNSLIYVLTLNRAIDEGDTVTVAYTAGSVTDADGTALATFAAKSVANNVDTEPSASYSGIIDTDKGDEGSDEVELTIRVRNSNQDGLNGYDENDFEVMIDNEGYYYDFNDNMFSDFEDNDDGTYTVIFIGDDPDTTYELDLWVDGVKIENDYEVTTPDEDNGTHGDEKTYSLTSSEKTIRYGDLELYIPEDAWDGDDCEITIEYTSSYSSSSLDDDQEFASDVFTITKDESGYFDEDVTLTLSFADYDIDEDDYDISIYYYSTSSGEWEELDNVDVNWYTEEVSGDTDHFTRFAAIATEIDGNHTTPTTTTTPNSNIWTNNVQNTTTPSTSTAIWDISGHWAEFYIRALENAGIVQGAPDGSFSPNNIISRAEFCVMLVKAFDLSGSSILKFADTRNHWAGEYISTAVENGVMKGYSSTYFGPDDPISREQMATAIANTIVLNTASNGLSFRDSDDISPWAYNAVVGCTAAGIIVGDQNNFFHPQDYASKAEAATIIYRAWE